MMSLNLTNFWRQLTEHAHVFSQVAQEGVEHVRNSPTAALAVPTISTFIGMAGLQTLLTQLSLVAGFIISLVLIRQHTLKNKVIELQLKLLQAKLSEQGVVNVSSDDQSDT